MRNEAVTDPDLEQCIAASVERGDFPTIEEARADFWAKLDESIAQADAGQLEDIEVVWARLRRHLTDLPHAAE